MLKLSRRQTNTQNAPPFPEFFTRHSTYPKRSCTETGKPKPMSRFFETITSRETRAITRMHRALSFFFFAIISNPASRFILEPGMISVTIKGQKSYLPASATEAEE
ncbi:hypothetical protein VTH06DRAFT_826 [Thermothelomyces fergusii]